MQERIKTYEDLSYLEDTTSERDPYIIYYVIYTSLFIFSTIACSYSILTKDDNCDPMWYYIFKCENPFLGQKKKFYKKKKKIKK